MISSASLFSWLICFFSASVFASLLCTSIMSDFNFCMWSLLFFVAASKACYNLEISSFFSFSRSWIRSSKLCFSALNSSWASTRAALLASIVYFNSWILDFNSLLITSSLSLSSCAAMTTLFIKLSPLSVYFKDSCASVNALLRVSILPSFSRICLKASRDTSNASRSTLLISSWLLWTFFSAASARVFAYLYLRLSYVISS